VSRRPAERAGRGAAGDRGPRRAARPRAGAASTGGGPPEPPRGARGIAYRALAAYAADPTLRVDALLELRGADPRDVGLATEIARGVVRRQSLLDHLLLGLCARGLPADTGLQTVLRIGAYQLVFLDRVPAHAAVDQSVRLCGPRQRGFVNAVLRRVVTAVAERPADPDRARDELPLGPARTLCLARPLPDPVADPAAYLALVFGLPEFLCARWIERHGPDRARTLAEAADRPPGVHLRAVGCDRATLAAELGTGGVETEPAEHPGMLRWTGGATPFATEAFAAGRFVVQDPTAVAAAEAVGARPGEVVLDLCAAPGTKATLIAEAVGPAGQVFAHDVDAVRRRRVAENAARLRMPWLRVVDSLEGLPPVDSVLVDVPCSNTGVLARRVEVRHRLNAAAIDSLADLQLELLLRGLDAVRPGGTVVYSTCSLEAEEDDAVVDAALAARPGARVEVRRLTWPDPPRHDGGYFAVLRRGPA
jgi:16S rRNA (cytosine967-C5)-methyltransferase